MARMEIRWLCSSGTRTHTELLPSVRSCRPSTYAQTPHNTYTFRQCVDAFDPLAGVSLEPLGSRTFSNVTSNRVVKSELSFTIRISFSVSSSAELNGHGCIQAMPSYRRILQDLTLGVDCFSSQQHASSLSLISSQTIDRDL